MMSAAVINAIERLVFIWVAMSRNMDSAAKCGELAEAVQRDGSAGAEAPRRSEWVRRHHITSPSSYSQIMSIFLTLNLGFSEGCTVKRCFNGETFGRKTQIT